MLDLLFVALIIGFFGIAAALVRVCDRILGPDELAGTSRDATDLAGSNNAAEAAVAKVTVR